MGSGTALTTADAIAERLAAGGPVRPVGGGTKLGWGAPARDVEELRLDGLDGLVAHHEGDLTAIVQPGLRLGDSQRAFAEHGQMLALDPPDGGATLGGVLATGDSGPLRHRYGAPRDLILGVQVALSDGTVARAGSRVIKNVAGYDLAKLMCGAFGTLGVITEATIRLHPRPVGYSTALGATTDGPVLARAARALAAAPLELECLDVRWDGRSGGALLARAGGRAAEQGAEAAAEAMRAAGLDAAVAEGDDEVLWAAQRARQRAGTTDAIVRVSARPTQFEDLMAAVPSFVARAAHGLAWARVAAAPEAVAELRARLAPAPCVLLDAPERLRALIDPWGPAEALPLMRRLKERFDPRGVCNPGIYVGGI